MLHVALELVLRVTGASVSHGVSVQLVQASCNALLNGHLDSASLVSDGSFARVSKQKVNLVLNYLPLRSRRMCVTVHAD